MAYRKYDPTPKTPPAKKPTEKKVAPKASTMKVNLAKAHAAKAERLAIEEAHKAEVQAAQRDEALARGEAAREKRRATLAQKRAENAEAMLAEQRAQEQEREATREQGSATGRQIPGIPTGRQPSTVTRTARANLYAAFEDMGGVAQLVTWGRANPTEFYRIWARLIPVETDDETKTLPLEVLLEKLSSRADMTVEAAARSIGQEALTEAAKAALVEDAAALFQSGQ